MGNRWADALPRVEVSAAEPIKPVTLIYPYFENPQFLRRQIAWWSTYPEWLRACLTAIVVDDGSPVHPAAAVLSGVAQPFPVRLYRIDEKRPWNWLAARNIGFHHAPDGWCVVTDMDHVIPESTAVRLVWGAHHRNVIYGFERIEHTGQVIHPHPNSWFLTRATFWAVGGYDETCSGHYGSDGDWRRRCAEAGPIQILTDRLIRHEYQEDASTTAFTRKLPSDTEAIRRIVASRREGWRPKVLSFPYHEVRP